MIVFFFFSGEGTNGLSVWKWEVQAWNFSAAPQISTDFEIPEGGGIKKKIGGKKFIKIENLTLECIKTAVFDTRNPKSPYRGRGLAPLHPPPAQSIRSLAKLSSSFFKYFLSHPWKFHESCTGSQEHFVFHCLMLLDSSSCWTVQFTSWCLPGSTLSGRSDRLRWCANSCPSPRNATASSITSSANQRPGEQSHDMWL